MQMAQQIPPPLSSAGESDESSNSFQVGVGKLIRLLQHFSTMGLTYEQLHSFSTVHLGQAEKEFIQFLQRNPEVFHRLAGLDRQPGVLSADDLKLAAGLAGDALMLSPEDLKYLQEARPANARKSPGETRKFPASDLITLLSRLSPDQPIHLDALQHLSLTGLSPDEEEMLRFLRSTPAKKLLQKLASPHDGLLLPEVIRVLTSLIWNPSIYGAMPLVFMQSPMFDDEDTLPLEKPGPPNPVSLSGKRRKRYQPPHLKAEVHASKLMEILHKIDPHAGTVTLDQLQAYQPADPEEARTLGLLRQGRVFQALAQVDGQPDSLSETDIRLTMTQEMVVLYDPYLMLVMLP